jgi:hypothetical protein
MGYNPTVENCADGLPVPARFITRLSELSPVKKSGNAPAAGPIPAVRIQLVTTAARSSSPQPMNDRGFMNLLYENELEVLC